MDHHTLLAKGADWVELIIILVLVGGGVFSSVAQAIIKKMRGEQPDEPDQAGKAGQAPPARAPQFPVARPLPPAGGLPQAAQPRVPVPQVPRPLPPAQIHPVPNQPPMARLDHPRVPQPPAPRPIETQPGPRPQPKRRPGPRTQPKPVPQAEPREPKEEVPLAQRHLEVSADVLHAHTEDDELVLAEHDDPIHRPTRHALRFAILMNEVLGPPVALRPPDDRF